MRCAGAVVLPAALIVDRPWTLRPSALSLGAAAALALFCTALALLLYFRLVRTLGSMGVASQAYLRSGVSVMLGILLLGETFRPAVGLGLVAVILGVAAINLPRSEEHTSELQSLMRISYAVFCLTKKNKPN